MRVDPELHQRLLELIYELLPDDEATALRQRITSEPELAAAFAQAQQTAGLLAEAACMQAAVIPLTVPEVTVAAAPVKPADEFHGGWRRNVHWFVGLAAGLLLLVVGGGYLFESSHRGDLDGRYVRMVVTGPAKLQAGAATQYSVATTTLAGKPRSTLVRLALTAPSGQSLLSQAESTDENGRLTLAIPATFQVPAGSSLVLAAEGGESQRVQTRLDVEPARYVTQLSMDKPLYLPGETVYYRSLTLNRSSLAAEGDRMVHFEIQDPSGAVVAGSELDGATLYGVGSGAFDVPPELAGGEYTLVARSPDGSFPEERRAFFIRHFRLPRLKKELEFVRDSYGPGDQVVADFSAERTEGGALANAPLRIIATVDGQIAYQSAAQASSSGTYQVSFTLPNEIAAGAGQLAVAVDDGGTQETIAKTIPINLGKLDVRFYAEGGDLVAGLENRVYFTGHDPLGEPVHIEGKLVDGQGHTATAVKTEHEGMGAFRFTPQPGETYTLEITSPKDVSSRPDVPAANAARQVVLSTGSGVFAAGKPIDVTLSSNRADMPLVVAAYCRGAQVGQQAVTTKKGEQPLSIELPETIGGVVRLTVYDYSNAAPEPLAERLVYRRPSRELRVRVGGHSERYSPGEHVDLSLMVTDEKGQPARRAALGVSVVDDALLSLADDDTPRMKTHFLLTTEVENAADLEDADFYLSDDPKSAAALDLLLGTQGWRRFIQATQETLQAGAAFAAIEADNSEAEQRDRLLALEGQPSPPAVFDNLEGVRQQYEARLATVGEQRGTRWATVGLAGGIVLLLIVLALVVSGIASEAKLWIPSLATATACLALSWVWTNHQAADGVDATQVAWTDYSAEPPPAMPMAAATAPFGGVMLLDELAKGMENRPVLVRGLAEGEQRLGERRLDRLGGLAPADKNAFILPGMAGQQDAGAFLYFDGDNRDRFARLGRKPDAFFKEKAWGLRGLEAKLQQGQAAMPGLRQRFERGNEIGQGRGGLEVGFGLVLQEAEGFARLTIREYAHVHQPVAEPGVRSDFTQTLFWHPLVVTDETGKARVQFDLSDAVTTFHVNVDAHGDGRIGSGEGEVISRIPFSLEPKLPLEVTAGDTIDLPVAVVNDTRQPLDVALTIEAGELLSLSSASQRQLMLEPEQRRREYIPLAVVGQAGEAKIRLHGAAGPLADAVERSIHVVPPGFPITQSYAGQIDGPQELTVSLPDDWAPGSLEVSLQAFPSTLADLQKGLDGILREPTGCFEQASTSNYPNVLTLQYLEQHRVADPDLTRRARELLKSGYGLLSGYECPQKGYEWFGGDPGHEALTAYGLMEFTDMREVFDVNPEMIERTRRWLLARRDGKGSFLRNSRALDSFGAAPAEITDAYIVWALTEAGQTGIDAEVRHVKELAGKSVDPYLVSLAAASLINSNDLPAGRELLDRLAKAQAEDGHLMGTQGSITRSGGLSLSVETTSLAVLAWLKQPEYRQQAQRAIDWIIKSRQGSGGFGSTQATILALKALVAHANANRKTVTGGELVVRSGGAEISRQAFQPGQQRVISIDGLEGKLTAGDNRLTISLTGGNKLPYVLDVSYRSRRPASDDRCPVRLTTLLTQNRVRAGDTVQLAARLTNTSDQGQPMTMAILGLPAGLEPRPDQLEELKKAGTLDYYETRAREVICYWRALAPQRAVDLKLDLVAEIPGRYTGPASRTYLYYTAEQKQWVAPLEIEITRE